jgi:hypothetical protein
MLKWSYYFWAVYTQKKEKKKTKNLHYPAARFNKKGLFLTAVGMEMLSVGAQYVTVDNKIKCLSLAVFFFWQPHQ